MRCITRQVQLLRSELTAAHEAIRKLLVLSRAGSVGRASSAALSASAQSARVFACVRGCMLQYPHAHGSLHMEVQDEPRAARQPGPGLDGPLPVQMWQGVSPVGRGLVQMWQG